MTNRLHDDKPLLSQRIGGYFKGMILAAGAMGLSSFACHVTRPGRILEAADQPEAGENVRSELLHIWLPESLKELTNGQSQPGVPQTHDALRQWLELRKTEHLWYAFTIRGHQRNGEFADCLYVRRPYNEPYNFPELLEILSIAADKAAREQTEEFLHTSITVMSDELSKREPREVIEIHSM